MSYGAFNDEYEARLRRLANITDDSLPVRVEEDTNYGGYCETCSYEEAVLRIEVFEVGRTAKAPIAKREFTGRYAFSDLMIALQAVELE